MKSTLCHLFINLWDVISTIVRESTICWAMLSSLSFHIFWIFLLLFVSAFFSREIQNILWILLHVISCNPLIVFYPLFPLQANMIVVTNLQKTKVLGCHFQIFNFLHLNCRFMYMGGCKVKWLTFCIAI
jgi:hypothetical protein